MSPMTGSGGLTSQALKAHAQGQEDKMDELLNRSQELSKLMNKVNNALAQEEPQVILSPASSPMKSSIRQNGLVGLPFPQPAPREVTLPGDAGLGILQRCGRLAKLEVRC